MAIELDLCDAIVTALRAATFALPVDAQVELFPNLELESHYRDGLVEILVVPNSTNGTPSDLAGGDEETLLVNVLVCAKLGELTRELGEVLLTLTRAVWSTIESELDSNAWQWIDRDATPVYDHYAALRQRRFASECVFRFRAFRQEDAA